MDPLFWILAGVVVGCVIGIGILWRLEGQAERRAADTQLRADVSARLKIFDPRAAVEAADTRPVAAAHPEVRETPRPGPSVAPPPSSLTDHLHAPMTRPPNPSGRSLQEVAAQEKATPPPHLPAPEMETSELPPLPEEFAVAQWGARANGKAAHAVPAEVLAATPEAARLRAAELGRERRYLEQALEEQQAQLEQLLHDHAPGNTQEKAAIGQLQSELAEQRRHLNEIIMLEERYRQLAVPSLEQLAREYKNTASPHTPRAFGVRRHSLAPIDSPGKHPPAPPAQAKTDTSP
jgi:hypothetical protein